MNFKHFVFANCVLIFCLISGCQPAKTPAVAINNTPQAVTEVTPDTVQATDSIPVWVSKKGPYNPSETILHDIVHTRLRVKFDWQKQYLLGEASLTLKPYFYPQNNLVLDAKGMDIQAVKLISGNAEKDLKYTYNGLKLTITLDKSYNRTEQYQVFIQYTAKPNELAAKGSAAITSDKGLYFINPLGTEPNKPQQIWTQGETEANSVWFPTIDKPNQRMTQEIYITTEAKFTTLSNGTLQYSRKNADGTRTDYWKLDKPHAPYLAMIAVGNFAIVPDKWRNMEVNYYVEPQYKNTAKAIFGNTPAMLEFFSKKLGVDYPWDKYAQIAVREYVSGAMENTTASVFMEEVQVDRRGLLDANWDFIIAHELFHQWFGDMVTLESWANLPLNESFANYSEYLWEEHKNGKMAADAHGLDELQQYLAESETKQEPLIRYNYLDKEDMFDSHSYAKGGRILHMLRTYIGDDAFFTALKNYLTTHKFTSVEVSELRMAFEDVTGEDLNWFFNQWFLAPGHPVLNVQHTYQAGKLSLTVQQLQDSAYTPIYKLPLKVAVWVADKKTEYPVTITKAQQTFTFPVTATPQLVLFDADQVLVGQVNHQKTDAEYIYQFNNSDNYIARTAALKNLSAKVAEAKVVEVFKAALKDPFWQLKSDALSALEKYAGKDESVVAQIKELAIKDKKSSVRADALKTLATFENADNSNIYIQSLNDSSYAVVAAAIEGLTTAKKSDQVARMKAFENYNNGKVLAALAGYYAFFGTPAQYNWYLSTVDKMHGEDMFFFLQNFGGFLRKISPSDQKPALTKLEKIARTHPTYYIKLGAYQALTIASDSPEMNKIKADIKTNEKDPKLIEIYKNLNY